MSEEPDKKSFPKLKIFSPEKDDIVILLSRETATDVLDLPEWLETEHKLSGFRLMLAHEIMSAKKSGRVANACFPLVAISEDKNTAQILNSLGDVLANRKATEVLSSSSLYIPLIRRG